MFVSRNCQEIKNSHGTTSFFSPCQRRRIEAILTKDCFDEMKKRGIVLKSEGPRIEGQLRLHQRDTGSADVQVALLTRRISQLTEHLRGHRKDRSCRRGLVRLVSNRRRLLDYLGRVAFERYQNARGKLQLRK